LSRETFRGEIKKREPRVKKAAENARSSCRQEKDCEKKKKPPWAVSVQTRKSVPSEKIIIKVRKEKEARRVRKKGEGSSPVPKRLAASREGRGQAGEGGRKGTCSRRNTIRGGNPSLSENLLLHDGGEKQRGRGGFQYRKAVHARQKEPLLGKATQRGEGKEVLREGNRLRNIEDG